MTDIPWIDLGPQSETIRKQAMERWSEILASGAFAGGPETSAFEREFAAYLGIPHVVGCADGTRAVELLLRASGIGVGDDVLTAPTSFIATAEAIALAGARPVFADVDGETGNLTVESVRASLTDTTRAVIVVHLAGRPAPVTAIRDAVAARGIAVFEDAAQAHGATLAGKRVGALADGAAFSFYPTKNLGACGEAGAVATPSDTAAAMARALRDHGQVERHTHTTVGFNARLDGMQAAVLRLKLPLLDRWNTERRDLAAAYREDLAGLPLGLPTDPDDGTHVYHLFTVRTPHRDALRRHLADAGIGTALHYPTPIHLQPAFAWLDYHVGSLPVAERYAREQLSLPLYPGLGKPLVRRVAAEVRRFFEGRSRS